MTEPEELDEDLFADLYEADEPATSAPPRAQSISAPEPVEATVPISTAPQPQEAPHNANDDTSINMGDPSQNDYMNGQDNRDDIRWDHGGRGARMDVAAEQDNGGIGIKEDG
ncbi:MAG: hypothetical protein LQ338_005582 [Usnochroma carphineum]|nr:MAG: hypothetical protein LQ338_005582 [Usnochroma carphineum]